MILQLSLVILLDSCATVEAGKKGKKYNLNNLLAFAKAMKCSPRVFLPEDTSNF